MFLSAAPVVQDIFHRRSIGEYSFFPYLVQICNTMLWVSSAGCDLAGHLEKASVTV